MLLFSLFFYLSMCLQGYWRRLLTLPFFHVLHKKGNIIVTLVLQKQTAPSTGQPPITCTHCPMKCLCISLLLWSRNHFSGQCRCGRVHSKRALLVLIEQYHNRHLAQAPLSILYLSSTGLYGYSRLSPFCTAMTCHQSVSLSHIDYPLVTHLLLYNPNWSAEQ